MTISNLLRKTTNLFKKKGIKTASLDAEILMSYALKKEKEWVYANNKYQLNKKQLNLYKKQASKRQKHEPIAYITNSKEFYGNNFYVDKNVLTPRPETEGLVDLAIGKINGSRLKVNIAEIGTGSGCISITIALKENKKIKKITATDISKRALKVARKNARIHNIYRKIKFVKSDMLKKEKKLFDVIISNPPYVEENKKLEKELYFEPRKALFVYTRMWHDLLCEINNKLEKKGTAFLEICPEAKTKIKKIIKKENLNLKTGFTKDLWGKTRYAVLEKK